jgi:hypothetical protein
MVAGEEVSSFRGSHRYEVRSRARGTGRAEPCRGLHPSNRRKRQLAVVALNEGVSALTIDRYNRQR